MDNLEKGECPLMHDNKEKFVKVFVKAWLKEMNSDRFDLKGV